jgi:hypothetical protein
MTMTKIRDPKDLPTADEVRARLSYDPESGELTWLPRPGQDRHTDNKSQLKGAWPTANGRYRAQITIKGRTYSLGCFATPEEAHRAYCEAAKRHFGQFARAA